MATTAAPATTAPAPMLAAVRPLLVDVGIPVAGYYLLTKGLHVDTVRALVLTSIPPAVSAVWTAIRSRRLNALAALMLVVNVVGVAAGAMTGDPRLMLAKDGAVSSAIGIAILLSAALGRPLMSNAVMPIATRGDADRIAAWKRLAGGTSPRSAAFRRAETGFSLVWGTALLVECAVRVVLAYTLPVSTVVGLQTVILAAAIGTGVVGGKRWTNRIAELLKAERTAA